MNDRQELLDRMRAVRHADAVTTEADADAQIMQRAHTVRLYYQALIAEGFSEIEALQLTMTCTF